MLNAAICHTEERGTGIRGKGYRSPAVGSFAEAYCGEGCSCSGRGAGHRAGSYRAGLGERGAALIEIKGLRRAFPNAAIVITSRKLSGETSADVYRAGATAVVPLGALGDAIANLTQVFEAGKTKKSSALDETMVEEFHDKRDWPPRL